MNHHPGPEPDPADRCRKCMHPFDDSDRRFDGRAQFHQAPFCGGCTDRCDSTESADHWCVIDQWRTRD